MFAVLRVDDDLDVTPIAVGLSEADATELAARHIVESGGPTWPDLLTVFEAGVFEQVVTLWNGNRHQFPDSAAYRIVDVTSVMDEFGRRLDDAGL